MGHSPKGEVGVHVSMHLAKLKS